MPGRAGRLGKGSAQARRRARGPPFLPEAGLAALGGSDKASEASLHTMATVRRGGSREGNLGLQRLEAGLIAASGEARWALHGDEDPALGQGLRDSGPQPRQHRVLLSIRRPRKESGRPGGGRDQPARVASGEMLNSSEPQVAVCEWEADIACP